MLRACPKMRLAVAQDVIPQLWPLPSILFNLVKLKVHFFILLHQSSVIVPLYFYNFEMLRPQMPYKAQGTFTKP